MNRACFILPLVAFALSACDQTAVKKEAYDRGFADGREAGKAEASKDIAARAKAQQQRIGGALDRPTPGAKVTGRPMGPTSNFQGTALDERPKR